ncbi:MAG TPA: cytosine permease [Candidatus Dormibacteraeota bacterium]|nr:cytosine permease [Candidatus Dormibacteraeota bacterium]
MGDLRPPGVLSTENQSFPQANPVPDDEFLRIELRGLDPVPFDRRHGRPRELFFIWAGALSDFFSLFAGALLVSSAGLGFWDAALVLIAGAVAGGAFLGLLSLTGVSSGAPQIVQSRMVFGRRGAAVGGLLTMLIAIGWFAYDCAIAVTTTRALPILHAAPASVEPLLLVAIAAVSFLVAVYGHRTISVFQHVQVPAFLLVCAVLALFTFSHWNLLLQSRLALGPHLAAMALGFTLTFALIVSWVTYAADYSRYLPAQSSRVRVALASGGGSAVSLVLCGLLGAAIQTIDPGKLLPNLIVATVPVWFGYCFAAFIILAELSSNYLNVYSAALCALAIGIRVRRWAAATAVGVCGGLIAALVLFAGVGFQGNYVNFLTITYVWFPAWAVLVILDSLWRHRDIDPLALVSRRGYWYSAGVRWPLIAAFAVGTLATLLFFNEPPPPGEWGFVSPLAQHLFSGQPADISGLVGVLVTALAYWLARRWEGRHGQGGQSREPAAPALGAVR